MDKVYRDSIDLKKGEVVAAHNPVTGRTRIKRDRPNQLPDGKQPFGVEEKGWRKSFDHSWDYLEEVLTDLELRVVQRLCRMAKMNTNSLEPLDDETTQLEIAEIFSIDRRKALKMFQKFFDLGVYGRFTVKKEHIPYTKYWILNPYLSFGGKLIHSDIAELYKGTKLTNEYYKRMSL
jgi:hypothetical protein